MYAESNRRVGHSEQQRMRERDQAFRNTQQDVQRLKRNDDLIRLGTDSEDKAMAKRFLQQQHLEQREMELEMHILETQRLKEEREKNEKQEMALAAHLKQLKLEKLRDEKMRQRIREESSEIRQLKSQLEAAYATKEREAQIKDKEERIVAEITADLVHNAQTEREMKEHVRAAEDAETQRIIANEKYQKDLQEQVKTRQLEEEFAYQQYLKEKLVVDEVVRKIYEEDARLRENEMHKKAELREYIELFKKQQAEWNLIEKARLEAEAEKVKEYEIIKTQRETERKSKVTEDASSKLQVQEALAGQLKRQNDARQEYEEILQELLANEEEEKARLVDIKLMEKRINDRIELQRHHNQQMEMKAEKQIAQAEEEEAYRQQMMAKFAEDDRIEQMNNQKRRMKQLDHKRAVEELLEIRKSRFQAEQDREVNERNRELEEAKIRSEIIEEERQKLLAKHAKNLLGYLPKGIIRNENDIQRLGPSYAEQYKPTSRVNFEQKYL